jgi:5-methylcytosine-specific restriction endonuclease McrA
VSQRKIIPKRTSPPFFDPPEEYWPELPDLNDPPLEITERYRKIRRATVRWKVPCHDWETTRHKRKLAVDADQFEQARIAKRDALTALRHQRREESIIRNRIRVEGRKTVFWPPSAVLANRFTSFIQSYPLCVCYWCGRERRPTVDHVIPLAANGRHEFDNIQPSCSWCNSSKNDRKPEEFTRHLISKGVTPALDDGLKRNFLKMVLDGKCTYSTPELLQAAREFSDSMGEAKENT